MFRNGGAAAVFSVAHGNGTKETRMAVQSTQPTYAASSPTSVSGIDGFAARSYDVLLLAARIALGAIFVLSGVLKLGGLAAFSASLAARGVPAAWFWGPVGASVELIGGTL